MATEHKLDVLSLSETWPNNSVPEDLLTLAGFQRKIRSGGGVAVYCANHIPACRRHDIENTGDDIECIWLEILAHQIRVPHIVITSSPTFKHQLTVHMMVALPTLL